jgi:uncharacterized protein YecT (DUF1311 family)
MFGPQHPTRPSRLCPESLRVRAVRAWPGVLLTLALAGPAGAQDPCEWADTQHDLNQCTYSAWMAADEELNRAYAAALAAARQFDPWPEGRAESTLRQAQRAWVAFRDAACDAEAAPWDGGSAQPMILSSCLERLTLLRTDDLWAYAES